MNNGDESYKTFVANSSLKNLAISFCDNVTESRRKIKEEKWDLIILDAEPKRLKGEIPQVNNLIDVYINLRSENNLISIFVATANTSIDDWYKRIAKDRFYELPTSSEQLYEDIKAEVENNADYRLRKKYEKIYQFCNYTVSLTHIKDLLNVLEFSNNKEPIERNHKIPNQVRKVLEWLKNDSLLFKGKKVPEYIQLNLEKEKEYKYDKTIDEQPLNIFSKVLGYSNNVPTYVKRSSFACVSSIQSGSHHSKIDEAIIAGTAPYVTRSLIYELLNILYWAASQNEETFKL